MFFLSVLYIIYKEEGSQTWIWNSCSGSPRQLPPNSARAAKLSSTIFPGDDTEHTIAVIENGHVSHRQAGGSASRVVLEAIQRKHDTIPLTDELGYLTKTRDGRVLKSSTVYLRNDEDVIEGVLSINYDITELSDGGAGDCERAAS